MNVYRNGNYLGARGGGGGGAGARSVSTASYSTVSRGPSPSLPSVNYSASRGGDDQRWRHHRPMVGWRGGVVPPWLDCDVDEDGNLVCPDDFEFGAFTGRAFKDWVFPEPSGGRYVYRQFDTGDIFITESPSKGKLAEPVLVARGTKAWRSISSAIYARQSGKREAVSKAFAQIAAISSALVSANAKPTRASSKAPAKAEEVEEPEVQSSEGSGSDIPWIPLAVGGATLVGLLAIFGAENHEVPLS